MISIHFSWIDGADQSLALPTRATEGSSGYDISANLPKSLRNSGVELSFGGRQKIPCGFCLSIPFRYEAQIRPRSGLAINHGITVLNTPGTIDSDYRGEISVILVNHGTNDFLVRHGDRIAQIVFVKIPETQLKLVETICETKRGDGGFGSTGLRKLT